jgi:hypothetical protein
MLAQIEAELSSGSTKYSLASCYGPDRYTDPAHAVSVDPVSRPRRGTVLICGITSTPPTSAGSALLVVVDDKGTFTWESASDLPDWAFFAKRVGRSCREFVDDPYFSGSLPEAVYKIVVADWFLEHEPARLDTDHDGVPCEDDFSQQAVTSVWAGAGEP